MESKPKTGKHSHSESQFPLSWCYNTLRPDLSHNLLNLICCRYGLEFVRFALYHVWYGQRMEAYLRGYPVTARFEGHVDALSKGTLK